MVEVRRTLRHGDTLVVLLLVVVSLLFMVSGDRVRRVSAGALQSVVYYPLDKSVAKVRRIWALHQENRRWHALNTRLAEENALLVEAAAENMRLRQALGFSHRAATRMLPAEVIGRRGGLLEPMLIIDKGEEAGVKRLMTVVTPEGLVGRVDEVAARVSWVLPLVHPDSRVSGVVRRSRVQGIVMWRADLGLYLADVPLMEDVAPGDIVVTTGMGKVFPPGWPVGETVGITEEFGGLVSRVGLKPEVDFNRLEEVFVLLDGGSLASGLTEDDHLPGMGEDGVHGTE